MNVGIVGHESAKFTSFMEVIARRHIRDILSEPLENNTDVVKLISGGCHLGGVDIWAEEIALELGIETVIYKPSTLSWSAKGGYRDRNLRIAHGSSKVYCIVAEGYHSKYQGMTFDECYHCKRECYSRGLRYKVHVKSGGCWTAWKCRSQEWVYVPVVE